MPPAQPDPGGPSTSLTMLDRNAERAAAMEHCRVETTWVARNRPGITNHALAQALYNNLEQKNWTSDDYVEMTHYAPTVRFYISRPALKPAPGKGAYPGWVMNALGGIPAAIDPTIEVAGKTIAGTFVDMLTSPELLSSAAEEFKQRKAADPTEALLPADFMPPTGLAWPDYSPADGVGFAAGAGERTWHPQAL